MNKNDRVNGTHLARCLGAVGLIGATLGMGTAPATGQIQPKPSPSATPQVSTDAVVAPDGSSRQVKIGPVSSAGTGPSVQQKLESPTTSSRQLKLTDPRATKLGPLPPE